MTTDRLCLCEYAAEDLEDIFVIKSNPVVQLYNASPHQTRSETLQFIEDEQEHYRQRQEIIWAIRDCASSRVIGGVSVFGWNRYHRYAELGYDLAQDCRGQGYAQEAIQAVIRFGFASMQLQRIEIWTSAANERSVRLAQRLGFSRDGVLRRRILEDDGQFHDCLIFGLLNDQP